MGFDDNKKMLVVLPKLVTKQIIGIKIYCVIGVFEF